MAGRPDKWVSRAQSSTRAPTYSSYKYHGAPPGRKWGLAPPRGFQTQSLKSRERGEVLRVGRLLGLSGVLGVARAQKLCQILFGFNGVFWALIWSSVETLLEFCEFWQRADPRVPLVYRDSGLSGYPRHYLRVGDLPIIVSHSFASLMLFVHLHTV
jgi:hypothetical protein